MSEPPAGLTDAEWDMARAMHLERLVRTGDERYIGLVKRRTAEAEAMPGGPDLWVDDAAIIAAVRRCPHRGRLLPPREGCGCNELFPCNARRGSLDGGTVARSADCTACVLAGGPPA